MKIDDSGATQTNTASVFVRESMRRPLLAFHAHIGRFPTTEEGLLALLHPPPGEDSKWRGPYLAHDTLPVDPWGRRYQYRSPALKSTTGYDLWSLGPDGVVSADDIGNW
jgi:general secretion pathway protein G